jgi:hypothetical protein
VLRGMTTGKFVMGILTRLSISRCAVWAQANTGRYGAQFRIPSSCRFGHPSGASLRHTPNTSLLPPGTPLLTVLMVAKSVPRVW